MNKPGIPTLARCAAALALASTLAPAVALTPADLQRCRTLVDDKARLVCYDALAGAPATRGAPAAPMGAGAAASPSVSAPPVTTPAADFGRTGAGATQIESRIDGLFEGWDRSSRLRLANGQVWQVIDGSNAALALRDPVVRVRRASLGSFLMEIEGTNRTVRVRRVD